VGRLQPFKMLRFGSRKQTFGHLTQMYFLFVKNVRKCVPVQTIFQIWIAQMNKEEKENSVTNQCY
jgi:hypothetical protein